MLKRWLIGLTVLATAPLWVPPAVLIGLPIVIADILRREWEASIWDEERRKRRDECE